MQSIKRVTYTKALPANFFEIPKSIYASLPFSLSEDKQAIATLFEQESERHEIVIYTDDQNLRLVGIFPKDSNQCFFGFWETTDELDRNGYAFQVLLEDAQRMGKHELIGPLNFTTYQSYRVRLGNPSWIWFDKEPVNPSYYPDLLTKLGFNKHLLFESRMIREADIPKVYDSKHDLLERFKEQSFECIPLTPEAWQKHHMEIFELIHVIFSANPLYRAISYAQFSSMYNTAFASLLCPHSSVLFRDKKRGQLIAFSFCHPKYAGQNLPGDGKYIYERDFAGLKEKTLLVKSIGVHPEFRELGLMNALGIYAMLSFRDLYKHVIFCLTRNDNVSNNFTNNLPYEKVAYALFSRKIT
jgi:hypothetical protein